MIEIPEAVNLAAQLNDVVKGNMVAEVVVAYSPHKFAWYQGDPSVYPHLLMGKSITESRPKGGMIEIILEDAIIVLSEGARPAFHAPEEKLPKKHQLLLQLDRGSSISVSVQMYGGILAFRKGEGDNSYYLMAREKPTPLSENFDRFYFEGIITAEGIDKLSAKALLATEQRIPGLGNGTMQDILYNAKIHPKRKVNTITQQETNMLFESIKRTLAEMANKGGRNTEKDLFGQPGGYKTKCSKNSVGKSCEICDTLIEKGSYLGGSIYFCPGCQVL